METYRMINKELSINNQELRNVINKLKHEVTYLNSQLFEQREEFNRLKASIAKTIEQKYIETMALIFPDKIPDQKRTSKLDIVSHRRSCSNVTAADPIKNRSHSPPAGSSSSASDVMDESVFKKPIPRIVVEGSGRLSKSPTKCPQRISNRSESRKSEDVQLSESCTEDLNNSEDSELGQTLMTSNANLVTINEEKSCGPDVPNETLSDATINCLLDAPCSTPYNHQKVTNETTFQQKQLRVLVKKINQEELLQFLQLDTQNDHCSRVNVSRFKNTSFQSKSAQIEACHTERKCSQLNGSHITTLNNTAHKYNINSSSDKEYFTEAKPMFKQKKENLNSSRDKTMKKPIKRGVRNKENCDTDSDFTCSDDESNVGRRRLRNKKLSLKEPSLRAKLRNTTNIKL